MVPERVLREDQSPAGTEVCPPTVVYSRCVLLHVHHEGCIQLHMVDYQAPAIYIFATYILE